MATAKILGKGQLVIPAIPRKKFGIRPGCKVRVFEYGNLIHIVPPSGDPVAGAMGCLPGTPSLVGELLEERKKDFPA